MSIFSSNKLSKMELLELTIAQQKEIERLENEVLLLTQKVEKRDKRIKEMIDLVQVTNTLIKLTKIIDAKLTSFGEGNNG